MTKFADSFKYDLLLSLNSSPRLGECFHSIVKQHGEKKMLAATFNHRFFNLHEKNFIKNFIDFHNKDHLMFSMRPSSRRLLDACTELQIQEFRDLSQVIFMLQLMARYDIPMSLIDSNFLDTSGKKVFRFSEIESQIFSFIEGIAKALPQVKNISKQFPLLFSLEKLLPQLQDKSITLIEHYPVEQLDNNYDYSEKKITELEKDLFWVGFDSSFKDVPHTKAYPTTKWTQLKNESEIGKGLFEKRLRYCARCCLPETMEGITFDEIGICVPCRSSEEKMHINWEGRRNALNEMINANRSEDYYDCMLPMSGGKDSMYQAYVLNKLYGVTPLAVTHGQNWYSLEGRYNLENCLQKFDMDHIIFNMNRKVINKMARKSLAAIGDACWHCHIGSGTFPVQSAIAWNIKLMFWGESIAERDGRGSYRNQSEASLLYNLEVSARVKAEDMVDDYTSVKDLSPWFYPAKEILKDCDVRYIHLGDYFFWDEERQVEFIKRNFEWMDSKVENTYKGYKSVECVMAGVHDYANFIKRGIGRATVHASDDVRRGLLTREEGFHLAKEYDTQRPHALDFYLNLTGLTEDEFETSLKSARNLSTFAVKLNQE
jgi:N-acetyl sugar amidotransferase